MEMKSKNDKERALVKLKKEVNADINTAVKLAKECCIVNLLYLFYQLHIIRISESEHIEAGANEFLQHALSNGFTDSIKYAIGLIAKYGWVDDEVGGRLKIDGNSITNLILHINLLNSKYENVSLLQLFDVEVYGERDRYGKVYLKSLDSDEKVQKYFSYFLRIDEDNNLKLGEKNSLDVQISKFKKEYDGYSDLFEVKYGVNIDEICEFIDWLVSLHINDVNKRLPYFDRLENGNIDEKGDNTIINFCGSFIFDKNIVRNEENKKFEVFLDSITFNKEIFDEYELKYHFITRMPLIDTDGYYFLSPELILDSIFINFHYSLIETEQIKHEYIKRRANQFLDQIAEIAIACGFEEVDREFELYENKAQIGDIDIYFKNSNNEYLLIEAKNHALPMDVFFKDVGKTTDHLNYLKSKWEKMVSRRIDHLKFNREKYGIGEKYKYIVVSRYPEIISHYSNILILSIQEFKKWLNKMDDYIGFKEFYDHHYESMGHRFSDADIKKLRNANLILGT